MRNYENMFSCCNMNLFIIKNLKIKYINKRNNKNNHSKSIKKKRKKLKNNSINVYRSF